MDVVVGTVDGAWPGAVSGVFFGALVSAVVSVVLGLVVVEETIDGTIVLVEEVAVVVDDGTDVETDVEEARGRLATALPATPRYSHETVMVGGGHVAGHGKTTGKSADVADGAVALQPVVLAAVTCQSVPAGWPVPSKATSMAIVVHSGRHPSSATALKR
jgi:hypothetical protein